MVKKRLYLKLASWSQFRWFQFCWWHWKYDNKEPVEHMLPSPHEVWLGCWLWPHRCHQDSSQLVWSSAWTLACCCLLHCLADWPIGGTGWWHGGQACFSSSFHWGYLGCHQWLSVWAAATWVECGALLWGWGLPPALPYLPSKFLFWLWEGQ